MVIISVGSSELREKKKGGKRKKNTACPRRQLTGEEQLAINCSDVLTPLAAVPTSIQSDLGANISPFPLWHWLQTLLQTLVRMLSCERRALLRCSQVGTSRTKLAAQRGHLPRQAGSFLLIIHAFRKKSFLISLPSAAQNLPRSLPVCLVASRLQSMLRSVNPSSCCTSGG